MRTAAMPLGMAAGALCCYPITAFDEWSGGLSTPFFIFSMLFCTFCRVNIRDMRPQWLHLWLMVAQIVGSIIVYLALRPLGDTIAQGGMICALAPMAMGAVVIAGMLGANVTTMATHSLVCNILTAFIAPPIISMTGNGTCTVAEILMRVAPVGFAIYLLATLSLVHPEGCLLVWKPRNDIVLHLVALVGCHRGQNHLFYHREWHRTPCHRDNVGSRSTCNMPDTVRTRTLARSQIWRHA